MKTKNNIAFTLAEVLIVLGIIGFVSTLTIPTLIHQYKETVFVSRAKKSYSVFLNGVNQYKAKYNSLDNNVLFDPTKTSAVVMQNFIEVLSGAKYCTKAGVDCPATYSVKFQTPQNDGTGKNSSGEWVSLPFIRMADGSIVYIWQLSGNTTRTNYKKDSNGNYILDSDGNKIPYTYVDTRYAVAQIDTNGGQNPNQYGVDVFQVAVYQNKIIPMGVPYGGLSNILTTSKLNYKDYTAGADYGK